MPVKEVVLYTFADKITVENADELRVRLEMLVANPNAKTIVFDLGRVRMCDSCGLRLLIHCQREASVKAKKLILYRPDAILTDLFDQTKLIHVFAITNTLDPEIAKAIQ